MKKIIKLLDKNKWLLVSLCISFCFFRGIMFVRGINFDTVDDYNVMFTLSGYKTGTPYYQLTFFNTFFAFLISRLYYITNQIQWYTIIQVLCIIFSLTIIVYRFFVEGRKQKIQSIYLLLTAGFFLMGVFLYPTQRIQFTTTATLIGCAAVAIAFTINDKNPHRMVKEVIFSALLLVLCFLMRGKVGMSLFCFWGLALMNPFFEAFLEQHHFKSLIEKIKKMKVLLIVILITFSGIMMIRIGDQHVKNRFDNEGYLEYNQYRSDYQDYPTPSYEENQSLYESVGWDDSIYGLVKSLLYVDETINENAFKSITNSSAYTRYMNIENTLKTGVSFIKENKEALSLTGWMMVLYAFYMLSILHNRPVKNKSEVIVITLSCIGTFLQFYFLCMRGRVSLRTYQIIILPTITMLLLSNIRTSVKKHYIEKGIALCLLSLLLFNTISFNRELIGKDLYSKTLLKNFEEYAIQNSDKVFVHDYSISNDYSSYDPFVLYTDSYPTNVIIAGGSYTYTGAYYKQLQLNGLDQLYGKDFLKDDVYYVCDNTKRTFFNKMVMYMKKHNYSSFAQQVQVLEGNAAIFKFIALPEENYTGWYEFAGMKQYYVNGEIQTGDFTVDDIEYSSFEEHRIEEKEFEGNIYDYDVYGVIKEDEEFNVEE